MLLMHAQFVRAFLLEVHGSVSFEFRLFVFRGSVVTPPGSICESFYTTLTAWTEGSKRERVG